MTLFRYMGIIIVLSLVGWVLWRLESNRHILPCPSWLAWLVELDNPFAKAHKAQSIIESFTITENMNFLDVGCGPGRVLLPLAQKIAEKNGLVTGIDIQLDMIEKTKNKAATLGLSNVNFIHGAVDKIELNKEHYDAALMVCILGEIPASQRHSVIEKIAKALKPNGILSITETIFDPHFQSRQKVINLMQQTGFVQRTYIGRWFAYTMHFEKQVKQIK